jgi:hypothetical protein
MIVCGTPFTSWRERRNGTDSSIAVEADVRSGAASSGGGLTSAEARLRLDEAGPNTVCEQAPPRWRIFLGKFWAPVPWMLEAAIVLQITLGAYVEAGVIGALLLFNATLGFIQEGRASAVLAALKKRLAPTALVRRDDEWARLPASALVPGDAISLSLGAMVPADASIGRQPSSPSQGPKRDLSQFARRFPICRGRGSDKRFVTKTLLLKNFRELRPRPDLD